MGWNHQLVLLMAEIRRPPSGMYETRRKSWEKLPTSTGERRISDINRSDMCHEACGQWWMTPT